MHNIQYILYIIIHICILNLKRFPRTSLGKRTLLCCGIGPIGNPLSTVRPHNVYLPIRCHFQQFFFQQRIRTYREITCSRHKFETVVLSISRTLNHKYANTCATGVQFDWILCYFCIYILLADEEQSTV